MSSNKSLVENLKTDLPASLVVFLVALPLCLGVALASGAPLLSGIISGVIGGLIVGLLSQSQTSVSGPAAGLAAVVLASIQQLGSFDIFLTAVIIAGVMQTLMGILKAGFIADFIPNNVIKGLLAAIGIILILKQIPHAVGFDRNAEDDFSFIQSDGENTFSELINITRFFIPGAFIISLISIAILVFWNKLPLAKFRLLPASLVVVFIGVLLNEIFMAIAPGFSIKNSHLVQIPAVELNNLSALFHMPSLNDFMEYKVWLVAVTIAAIASLETLLNIEAVDKLDPHKRQSPPNRELLAQGIGNISAGFLGGIPVTSVIVRSSVNIQANNASKLSTIFHGILLFVSILFLSPILNKIPLASLAAILIVTGYKLAQISIFKEMWRKGYAQFIPFIITILAIVFTDLLMGVLMGLAVSIFFLIRSNFKNPFTLVKNQMHIGEVMQLTLPNQVSFFNKATIKNALWSLPKSSKITIDARNADYIDDDVIEIITDFKNVVSQERNIQLNLLGLREFYKEDDTIQFMPVIDKATQNRLQPNEVLNLLKIGNSRFVEGKSTDKFHLHQVSATVDSQNPMAVLVGCIDSRTSPEILFDAGIGDLLTIRIAGNIINHDIIGSLEIAVKKLGAKLIVVKGHSNCGAVALSMQHMKDDNMHHITKKIQTVAEKCGFHDAIAQPSKEQLKTVAIENARNSVREILSASEYIQTKVKEGKIGIVSAYHDLQTGQVMFDA
ncbi:MAG: SulP family inorganic anion transporter [Chitinophagaceae bacterium]